MCGCILLILHKNRKVKQEIPTRQSLRHYILVLVEVDEHYTHNRQTSAGNVKKNEKKCVRTVTMN